ncbi:MAG: hypothetical protein EXR39_18870 [Betaproteobacteria bacterium]|nr:hypothetical protein [Betaproteobacteria bacterium]
MECLDSANRCLAAKPVRIVVTFSPGGSSDIVARALAVPLQAKLGQPVVVDNRPGAGGSIGAAEIARAAPDGYNLLMSNTTPISLSPFMLEPSPYDPIKSFTHVSLVATVPDVVMVHPSVPVKTRPNSLRGYGRSRNRFPMDRAASVRSDTSSAKHSRRNWVSRSSMSATRAAHR